MLRTIVVSPLRGRRGLLWLPAVLILSGCAQQPQPSPGNLSSPEMNLALMKSVRQIQQVTDNLRAAHHVAWQGVYQGFPLQTGIAGGSIAGGSPASASPPPLSGPLSTRMYVQWSGSANILGRALAQKLGWTYRDTSGEGNQMDVSVYGRNESVLSVLKVMAAQLPDSVSLSVTPGHLLLRASGASGFGK